jgi:hypothetical protein
MSPAFDVMKRTAITPTFKPKRQKAIPTSAKHIMLNNPCATCPASLKNSSPSLTEMNPVIAPMINVLLISNTMATRFVLQAFEIVPD